MAHVQLRNEILFRAPTRIGLLADVTEALADAGVNILAIGAYEKDGQGEFLMITSSNKDSFDALNGLGGEIDLASVVVIEMPNSPGELAKVARRLADNGINIDQVYATAADAPTVMVVLRTTCEIDVVRMLEGL